MTFRYWNLCLIGHRIAGLALISGMPDTEFKIRSTPAQYIQIFKQKSLFKYQTWYNWEEKKSIVINNSFIDKSRTPLKISLPLKRVDCLGRKYNYIMIDYIIWKQALTSSQFILQKKDDIDRCFFKENII